VTTTTVSPEYLQEIAEQIWTSFLDPDGTSPLMPGEPSGPEPVGPLAAAITVSGAWRGHVVVECSAAAARNVAAALLGVELTGVTVADVTDALGELANVIGGNVKALLPPVCALSLPYVVPAAGSHWPAVTEICRLDGRWLGEPMVITVLERNADEADDS
jgi:chemotaxis protein CheX